MWHECSTHQPTEIKISSSQSESAARSLNPGRSWHVQLSCWKISSQTSGLGAKLTCQMAVCCHSVPSVAIMSIVSRASCPYELSIPSWRESQLPSVRADCHINPPFPGMDITWSKARFSFQLLACYDPLGLSCKMA